MAKNQVKQANQPKNQYNSISELDTKQKSDIAVPTESDQHDTIIRTLIPDKQIQIYYNSKQSHLLKRLEKEFPELAES